MQLKLQNPQRKRSRNNLVLKLNIPNFTGKCPNIFFFLLFLFLPPSLDLVCVEYAFLSFSPCCSLCSLDVSADKLGCSFFSVIRIIRFYVTHTIHSRFKYTHTQFTVTYKSAQSLKITKTHTRMLGTSYWLSYWSDQVDKGSKGSDQGLRNNFFRDCIDFNDFEDGP